MPSFPSLTKTYHTTTYDAISPTRPEATAHGKTVVITGGAGTIGQAIALAYSRAGASKVILLARTLSTLSNAKQHISDTCPKSSIHIYTADVSDKSSIDTAFSSIHRTHGSIHILINNAGHMPSPSPIASVDPTAWWTAYQTNVLGTLHVTQAFLSHCGPHAQCSLVNISAGLVYAPAFPMWSGYQTSKLAATGFVDAIAAEIPALFVLNVHPGVVESELLIAGDGVTLVGGKENLDDAQLSGDFVVWATGREGAFLRGRYLWANWDVEELMEKKDVFEKDPSFLTMGLTGWPGGLGKVVERAGSV